MEPGAGDHGHDARRIKNIGMGRSRHSTATSSSGLATPWPLDTRISVGCPISHYQANLPANQWLALMTHLSHLEHTFVGVAGEYFVAAELSLRGYHAAVTLRNSRGIDIIASSADASKSVSIQVKTSRGKSPIWPLNKGSEDLSSDSHFYVFVLLRPLGIRPDFFVVPSSVVAKYISTRHREWLKGSKRDGTQRKDQKFRKFADPEGLHGERWDVLGL